MAKMTLKRRLIKYSIIGMPAITLLILMATILNINYTHNIKGEVFLSDNIIYSLDDEVVFEGRVEFIEEFNTYGIVLKEGEVAKVNRTYYSYEFNPKKKIYEVKELNAWEVQKKEGWKLPVSIFISIGALAIIGLVSFNKLRIGRKHKELALLVSLGLGTAILYLINLIAGNMLHIFLTVFISYAASLGVENWWKYKDGEFKKRANMSDTERRMEELLNRLDI